MLKIENKTYTYKFPKAVPSDSDEYEAKFLEINSMDFSSKFDKKITNQYSITTYNKYGYAIGLNVKLCIYKNMKHEILNEENKMIVYNDIVLFLKDRYEEK